MNTCEEFASDTESDSPFESEVQEYVDSDKADSDIEIELYGQIHYLEDLSASTCAQSSQDGNRFIEFSPLKSIDSFHSVKSSEELLHDIKELPPRLIRFVHFESSTPRDSQKNNLIVEKRTNKKALPKAEIQKGKPVAAVADPKLGKSTDDSNTSGSVVICSEDNDGGTDVSVICIDSDEHCDSSSIMLNIGGEHVQSKDMILLDSTATSDDDSFGRDSVSSNPSEHEESLKFSFSATSPVSNHNDLWHIDHEDRFAYVKKRNRYHEKRNFTCFNCKKRGHISKDCGKPKDMRCYICGHDHLWNMCHQRMCGKCFVYGHSTQKCWYKACDLTCNLCKMRGHLMSECPDIWRRYHLTTSPDAIVKGTKELLEGVKKYCYNCGHEGHYGHECLRARMSPDTFPTWPFIISYRDPSRHLKKHLKNDGKGESSNSGRHYDFHPRHKHNKKHRSRADELREMVAGFSRKQSENSKKSKNKQKVKKKQFKEDQNSPVFKGNDFHSSASFIKLGEVVHKNKKRKKRDMDKLYAFKRKKQKLNATC